MEGERFGTDARAPWHNRVPLVARRPGCLSNATTLHRLNFLRNKVPQCSSLAGLRKRSVALPLLPSVRVRGRSEPQWLLCSAMAQVPGGFWGDALDMLVPQSGTDILLLAIAKEKTSFARLAAAVQSLRTAWACAPLEPIVAVARR
jgi:hypothetical protein